MLFEWDEDKNRANIQRHKIDFADAPAVFSGPMLVELDEREDYGGQRWIGRYRLPAGHRRRCGVYRKSARYDPHHLCAKGEQT